MRFPNPRTLLELTSGAGDSIWVWEDEVEGVNETEEVERREWVVVVIVFLDLGLLVF